MEYERIKSKSSIVLPNSIRNFNWDEAIKEEKLLIKYFTSTIKIKNVWWDKSNLEKFEDFDNVFQIASERYFGNYIDLLNQNQRTD